MVFVMDASRSMEKIDVYDNGKWKRRVTAVLDVCFEFIKVRRVYGYKNTATLQLLRRAMDTYDKGECFLNDGAP